MVPPEITINPKCHNSACKAHSFTNKESFLMMKMTSGPMKPVNAASNPHTSPMVRSSGVVLNCNAPVPASLIAQRLRRLQAGCFVCRKVPEEYSRQTRDTERDEHRPPRDWNV